MINSLCETRPLVYNHSLLQLSKQPLPCQFDFPTCFARIVASLANAYHASISKLNLVLDLGKWAGTVMGKMDTGQCVWTEVVRAVCYNLNINLCSTHTIMSNGSEGIASPWNSRKTYRLPNFLGTSLSRSQHFAFLGDGPAVALADQRNRQRIGTGRTQ